MNNYFVLVIDLEATCADDGSIPEDSMETIEIGACWANLEGGVMDRFQSFVRPVKNPVLTNFCTNLTGICQEDVSVAPLFPDAARLLREFVDRHKTTETSIWVSWGSYDFTQIARDSSNHSTPNPIDLPHFNAKKLYAKAQKIGKQVGMARAIELSGLSFIGTHHRALDDALNIARLLPWVYGLKTLKTSDL